MVVAVSREEAPFQAPSLEGRRLRGDGLGQPESLAAHHELRIVDGPGPGDREPCTLIVAGPLLLKTDDLHRGWIDEGTPRGLFTHGTLSAGGER